MSVTLSRGPTPRLHWSSRYLNDEHVSSVSRLHERNHKTRYGSGIREELTPAIESVIAEPHQPHSLRTRKMRITHRCSRAAAAWSSVSEDDNWIVTTRRRARRSAISRSQWMATGRRMIWQHGGRMILMSATIISPEEMVETLGYTGEWAVVRVP